MRLLCRDTGTGNMTRAGGRRAPVEEVFETSQGAFHLMDLVIDVSFRSSIYLQGSRMRIPDVAVDALTLAQHRGGGFGALPLLRLRAIGSPIVVRSILAGMLAQRGHGHGCR